MSQISSQTTTLEEPVSSPKDTIVAAKSETELEKGPIVHEKSGEYEIVKWDEGEPAK
jgi:hypothetical protein